MTGPRLAGMGSGERKKLVKSDGMENQDLTAAGSPGLRQEEAGGQKESQWSLRRHQYQR